MALCTLNTCIYNCPSEVDVNSNTLFRAIAFNSSGQLNREIIIYHLIIVIMIRCVRDAILENTAKTCIRDLIGTLQFQRTRGTKLKNTTKPYVAVGGRVKR